MINFLPPISFKSILKKTFFLGISAFSTISFSQPAEQTSFEGWADETVYTLSSWTTDGFSVPWVNGFNQNRAHIDNAYSHSGSNSLRIFFPQGEHGTSNSGAQAPLMVPAASQYYISYWLRFSDNFSWGGTSEGGKLPGLAGGGRCSGCQTCTGSNGFSARLMWRTGGKAVLYLYHLDKVNPPCGDNINLQVTPGVDFAFQKGQWYNIIERVKINTGNNYDGEVELWVDQQPALLVDGIRFVNNGDQVDNLYFSTFHGGSGSQWSPLVDSYIWFDDIVISTNASDVFTTLSLAEDLFGTSSAKSQHESIQVSPLPLEAGNIFSLSGITPESPVTKLEWVDKLGTIRREESFSKVQSEFPVPQLEQGFYVLKIYLADGVVSKKVLVR